MDDIDIALMMMEGDPEGARWLLQKYGGKLKAGLRCEFHHVLADAEIDEALNIGALKAFRAAHQYDERKGSLRVWLYKIARNAALDIIREEKRHEAVPLEFAPPQPAEVDITDKTIEREADAFAASLLMPQSIFRRMVNRQPLNLAGVERFAELFQTSLVSTAIRSVQLSDFPCAVVSIRDGQISWGFLSASLREGGCYATQKGALHSSTALEAWRAFAGGSGVRASSFASSCSWFQTFDRAYLQDLTVTEEFLPVPVMNTLLVLLSIRE